MHSFKASHESGDLKQARPYGQDVDLLRISRSLLPHLPCKYNMLISVRQAQLPGIKKHKGELPMRKIAQKPLIFSLYFLTSKSVYPLVAFFAIC